jgi:hypothetical protein
LPAPLATSPPTYAPGGTEAPLRHFSQASPSGAITFQPGDRTRADWLHQVYGEDSGSASAWSREALPTSPERIRHAQALMRWAESYREIAASRFRRKLDELDLKPGLAARPGEELAKLVDVPWPARQTAP